MQKIFCLHNRSSKSHLNCNVYKYHALPGRLEELVGRRLLHVPPVDVDVLVPVRALVLVDEAKDVEKLVGHGAEFLEMFFLLVTFLIKRLDLIIITMAHCQMVRGSKFNLLLSMPL